MYKFLLTAHIIVSVGWLGVVAAKLAIGVAAVMSEDGRFREAMYISMDVVNALFPPAAVATALTGVLLSLGTRWGVLAHYWIVVKIMLTVGVIATGIIFVEALIRDSLAEPSGRFEVLSAPMSLAYVSAAHVLMLGAATVVSVYKPWGKTRFGLREGAYTPKRGKGAK